MSKASQPERRIGLKRLLRFRLATLLLVMTLLGIWLGVQVPAARRQKEAVEALLKIRASISPPRIEYGYQFDPVGNILPKAKTTWPGWLRNLFGDDFFMTVVGVSLDGTRATDADLSHLSNLPHLTRLDLEYCSVTDEGIEYVATTFPDLVRLDLQATEITDAGLRHVQNLKQLEILLLGETVITDEALSNLAELRELRHVSIRRTQITGSGLKHLAGLSNLESLDLYGSSIKDEAVEYLATLTSLNELQVGNTQLSDGAMQELAKALPSCNITRGYD